VIQGILKHGTPEQQRKLTTQLTCSKDGMNRLSQDEYGHHVARTLLNGRYCPKALGHRRSWLFLPKQTTMRVPWTTTKYHWCQDAQRLQFLNPDEEVVEGLIVSIMEASGKP
tara:strand:+ start:225 stop:560 length:336 start_codon:yes stop_codon:yes gene_type:complete